MSAPARPLRRGRSVPPAALAAPFLGRPVRAPRAVLWDVDGTLAETERDGHRVAFNRAFESFGLPWRWGEAHYGDLLRVSGGRERLLHDMSRRGDAPPPHERDALARAVHARKNEIYAALAADGAIALRPGVAELLLECRARGVRMGVVTTTSRSNVVALLQSQLGVRWRDAFDVLVCGEDVRAKKPDPEAYLHALAALRLAPPDAVAIEDSPGGAAAARAADVPVVVTRSAYFAHSTIEGAVAIGPGLHALHGWRPAAAGSGGVGLDHIADWCAQRDSVSQYA